MEEFNYLGHDDHINHNLTITEEEFAYLSTPIIVNCVLNAICSFTAAAGNGVILLVLMKMPSLYTPSNTLLFGLALTDFFVGLFTQSL